MSNLISLDTNDSLYSDKIVDQLMSQYDENFMSLPDIELEPHLLISKVRKHYMEYLIQLLSVNYETNQRLMNKNIYLPSAIWRCAKSIELTAAQACMVVQIYRKNIVNVIKELKKDTKKGKLNKNLYDCLRKPPQNEKKVQVSLTNDQCMCSKRKRAKRSPTPLGEKYTQYDITLEAAKQTNQTNCDNIQTSLGLVEKKTTTQIDNPMTTLTDNSNISIHTNSVPMTQDPTFPPQSSVRESQDSDELMVQLEKLFQGDGEDEDIFNDGYCYMLDSTVDNSFKAQEKNDPELNSFGPNMTNPVVQDTIIETHAAQIKSLDARLASLSGLMANTNEIATSQKKTHVQTTQPPKKHSSSKWLCEEYFLKTKLFELFDEIRDTNRKKLARIKAILKELFGEDSDDDGVVSPLDETADFVLSCKERIAPWVVKLLTPSYMKGRIRGKTLFKAVAKHLIRLIYQCSKYPREYDVQSFVADFLNNHKMIRCEADFKQFRIENF